MRIIYINESQIPLIQEVEDAKREVTFEEFLLRTKDLLKDLLTNPNKIQEKNKKFFKENGLNVSDFIREMRDKGIITVSTDISEVEGKNGMTAKRKDTYKIPRANFKDKMLKLHKELFESQRLNEEGEGGTGGATSCGNVMQGGGSNPSAGTFDAPIGKVQRRGFWSPAQTRNEDEDNGSISMNKQK